MSYAKITRKRNSTGTLNWMIPWLTGLWNGGERAEHFSRDWAVPRWTDLRAYLDNVGNVQITLLKTYLDTKIGGQGLLRV